METPLSSTKRKIYKSLFIVALFGIWVFGLYEFRRNQDAIDNFQFFYVQRYAEAAVGKIKNASRAFHSIPFALSALHLGNGESRALPAERQTAESVSAPEISKSPDKSLPYHDAMNTNAGWLAVRGIAQVSDHTLKITVGQDAILPFVVLEGTESWRDYQYWAQVRAPHGSSVALIGRYVDSSNYASCLFSDGHFALRQTINGSVATLVEWHSSYTLGDSVKLVMNVEDATASCYIGDKLVGETARLDPSLHQGVIGITLERSLNPSDILTVREVGGDSVAQHYSSEPVPLQY